MACKDALAQLVENPASYTPNKVDEVLAEYERKLGEALELEETSTTCPMASGGGTVTTYGVREKRGDTTHNYLQEPPVRAAWDAFKEKVKEAQDKYEVVRGLKAPTTASQ